MKVSSRQCHMYAERLRRFYPSEPVPTARESKNSRDAIQCTRGYDVFKRLAERLLEPLGEPDIIECDGKLYVPDKECEFIPEAFGTVWDEEDQCLRIDKPSEDCSCFTCSECGQELMFDWSGEYSWFEPEHPYKPIGLKYCPGCGARVLFPHPWLGSKEEG